MILVFSQSDEQGFVQAGHCCLSSPELKPNKEIKVQDKNQKPNKIPSARTKVQRCKQPNFESQALIAQNPMLCAVLCLSANC